MADLPNEQQRENLAKLADYLATGKTRMHFDMVLYCVDKNDDDVRTAGRHRCGTVGCAVGHGPSAGIKPAPRQDWDDYADEMFGAPPMSDVWFWCFDWNWCFVDNTPEGAAARIRWFLKHGVPADAIGQRLGRAPLCYHAKTTPARCTICRDPFTTDDMVLPDGGGEAHVACIAPDEAGDASGPLHPDETIPVGYPWEPGR